MDAKFLRLVKDSYNNFALSAGINAQEIPQNKTVKGSKDALLGDLYCAVIENLHIMQRQIQLKPFDSVRGVFYKEKNFTQALASMIKTMFKSALEIQIASKGFSSQEMKYNGWGRLKAY